MIIDQLFTRPIFEAADPSRLIATITLAKEYNADEPTKEIDLTGRFQGDVKSQMNQAADYLTQFLQSKGFNFTSIQLKYQGMVMNAQNRGSMAPQSDWEKEAEATANQMRAKRPAQNTAPALKEFAPSDDDSNGSDPEELLRRMAAHWWNGNERQMAKVENTLAAMGWEIGQDEGYDDGGVFVVRAGDEHGGSYISWPHEDLELNEGRKKKNKKTSRSLGRYFFPGFGYYGSGESGEGGGDGGGGESANPAMEEGEYDSRKPFGVRYKVFAGREGRLTTREYWTSSEQKLQRAVAKIEALDNFYEIDGYSYPKESQGVTDGKARGLGEQDMDNGNLQGTSPDDEVKFFIDSEPAYYAVMDRFGDHIDFRGDDLVAPQRLWSAIQQTAGDAGGAADIAGLEDDRMGTDDELDEQGVAEGLTEMDKSQTPPGRDGNQQSPRDDRQSRGRDTGPREGPEKIAKPITKEKMVKHALDALSKSMAKKDDKKKDVKESDTLMIKLKRAMVQEGRVKELALDLKTLNDADFMKKYGKAKAAIRASMTKIDETRSDYTAAEMADMLSGKRSQKQVDADAERTRGPNKAPTTKESTQFRTKRLNEKLTTSDTLSQPAAGAGISRLGKKDIKPELNFRKGLVGDDDNEEIQNEPELGMFRMGKPVEPNDAATKEFMAALTPSQQDNRFTAPAGWRYVEKDEDPARYGTAPAAGNGLPNLVYDPQSRTLKSADAPALDMSPKSKFKFDRTTQSQVPADGSGANRNIDNATRDRARAYAAQQNAPADAARQKVDWKTIYALNKATIGSNPNVIRPRMQLNMPNGTIYLVQPGDTLTKIAAKQNQVNELSTNKLAQYKTAAAKDAREADQAGDVKRGDKRFSGIVKATKKQFDNDAKQVDESRAARRALMARIVNHR
jgi:hypothetical protein